MGILAVLQLITQVAVESQVATGAIFGLIKGVRDGWSSPNPGETVTDEELIQIMRQSFADNSTRNAELRAEIEAGNLPNVPEDRS